MSLIQSDIQKIRLENVDWIYQEGDRDNWWASMNTLINPTISLRSASVVPFSQRQDLSGFFPSLVSIKMFTHFFSPLSLLVFPL
jgi:hypothetical protein